MPPDKFAQTVTRDLLRHACANREIVANHPRNARTLIGNMTRPYFSFERMGWRAAGSASWENAKDDQKKQFYDALYHTLLREHFSTVYQYCDGAIAFRTPESAPGSQKIIVHAEMRHRDAPTVDLAYSLVQTDNGWKIFDLAVDGQSLIARLVNGHRENLTGRMEVQDIQELSGRLREQIEWDVWANVALAVVIGLEALGVGLGSAALFAFMARATHPAYTATQLALFTSLMATPRTFINAAAGWLVEGAGGWFHFFWLCFFLAFPGMLLLFKVAPWNGDQPKKQEDPFPVSGTK
jgi:ABC-type transporter MlaC component